MRCRGGKIAPDDPSKITHLAFVANGDHGPVVASEPSVGVAQRLTNAEGIIHPDSGHSGIFHYCREFVPAVIEFLDA